MSEEDKRDLEKIEDFFRLLDKRTVDGGGTRRGDSIAVEDIGLVNEPCPMSIYDWS